MIEINTKGNPNDKYSSLSEKEKRRMSGVVNIFLHELITTKGSCAFDLEYGTYFIQNLGKLVNKYKIEYFFNLAKKDIIYKYRILNIDLVDVTYDTTTQEVTLEINAIVDGVGLTKNITHHIDGDFTEKDILEQ